MAPWQSRCLQLPWSSPSHCQLPQEPSGQGITATSVTTSAEALPGLIPSLRGPGPVDGAELGLHLGICCCSCPGLWMFASSGSCTGGCQGVYNHGHTEVEQASHLALVLG